MKVVLISSTYPPRRPARFCGVGDYSARLGDALAKTGVDVAVLTGRDYVGPPSSVEGVRIHPLVARWDISSLPAIRRFLRHENPAVVNLQYQPHIFGRHWTPFNLLLAALLARSSRPLVTTVHTVANPTRVSPTRLTALALMHFSRKVVVTNESHLHEVSALWSSAAKKTTLIPVGSNVAPDPGDWERREQIRNAVRRRLGIETDAILMAHFGRVYPGKGVETVLEAHADLHRSGLEAHLILLGHVPAEMRAYREELAARARGLGVDERVVWVADADNAAVTEYLFASDLYVVPYADGLTTRRGSAMAGFAHGLPVISTRGSATPSLFKDGENVVLVPPGEPAALSRVAAILCDAPAQREELARAGRELARFFSWPSIAEHMRRVLVAVQE